MKISQRFKFMCFCFILIQLIGFSRFKNFQFLSILNYWNGRDEPVENDFNEFNSMKTLESFFDELKDFEYQSEFLNNTDNLTGEFFTQNNLLFCDIVPPDLKGKIKIYPPPDYFEPFLNKSDFEFMESLSIGGQWKPQNCIARHRVAIVIPYKNRLENLKYFLYHMHPFLQRQQLEYQIFVVEQANDELFNKGVLMNSGFLEIMSLSRPELKMAKSNNFPFAFDCVIFHDVDLLPEDDRNMYSCSLKRPRHLTVAIDKYKYKIFYEKLIGGALNFRPAHFIQVNGYSNEYWAWGGEDDDMEKRLSMIGLKYERPNINIAHYKMMKHNKSTQNPKRYHLLKVAKKRFQIEGLNSIRYGLVQKRRYKLFTHLLVDVGSPPREILDSIRMQNKSKVHNAKKPRNSEYKFKVKFKF